MLPIWSPQPSFKVDLLRKLKMSSLNLQKLTTEHYSTPIKPQSVLHTMQKRVSKAR